LVEIPRINVSNRQTIEALIDEEALLFAKFLRNETENGLLGLIVLTEEETAEGVELDSNIPEGYCSSWHSFLQTIPRKS